MVRNLEIKLSQSKGSCCDNRTTLDKIQIFRTEVFTSINVKDIDAIFHAVYNELTQKIHSNDGNGSEWVVDQFTDVDFGEHNVDLDVF